MAGHQIGDSPAAKWARLIAALIVDELIRADIMTIADNDRAIAIAAEEIYIRVIVAGDRPPAADAASFPPPQAGEG
jgi:hypothetical protein